MEKQTFTYMVMQKKEGGLQGLGSHKFQAAPHVGEYVVFNDAEGIGQAVRIVQVFYAVDSNGGVGDLWVEAAGTVHELRQQLLKA